MTGLYKGTLLCSITPFVQTVFVYCSQADIDSIAQPSGRLSTGSSCRQQGRDQGADVCKFICVSCKRACSQCSKTLCSGVWLWPLVCEIKLWELVAWEGNFRGTIGTSISLLMGQDLVSQDYRCY